MSYEVHFDSKELEALLKKLSREQMVAVLKRAISRGCVDLEKIVKTRSPVRATGHLRAGWTHEVSSDGLEGMVGTDVRYAKIVEEGYSGVIRPTQAKALKLVFDGQTVYRASARGQKGQHFVARVLEENQTLLADLAKQEADALLEGT